MTTNLLPYLMLHTTVIGGWSNTQSVIRLSAQGSNAVLYTHNAAPLDPTEYRVFQIYYLEGNIRVYEGDQPPILVMEYTDPNPRSIGAIGYSTGWSSTGDWEFNICDFPSINNAGGELTIIIFSRVSGQLPY